jgi:hypothetical protein
MRQRSMRLLFCLLPLALGGCNGAIPLPPPMPTVPQAQALMALAQSIPPASVPVFYESLNYLTRVGCGAWFDGATVQNLNVQRQQSTISALSTATLSGLGLAGVGSPYTAGLGIAGNLAQTLTGEQMNQLTGPDAPRLWAVVDAEQAAIIRASGQPLSASQALNMGYDVYKPCSATGIALAREQALDSALNHIVVTGAGMPTPEAMMGFPGGYVPRQARIQ